MIAYQYKHGDKPLEGYTIQRAAGRGGFGEVYYAVSDAGREVALKLVQGYEQIELRGISHCMNLKSPHLVSIFDVRYGSDRRPWVIMEYVAGPTLRQLIDDRPAGLGLQKSIFFLREIAKGLTTLHDCGVVHRDLKPGNVFFENGYVKIGDYGLSKAMTVSQHSGQTVTVGTVHYMAPEIGVGRYDKSIDVYALGVMLYEMITGVVPFVGASPSEILMKHLAAEPDLTGVDEFIAGVIRKALAKKPADRYGSAQELVEAVFGAEHVRQSVSHFSVEDLTMVAGRVARQAGVDAHSPAAAVFAPPAPSSVTRIGEDVSPAERWRRQAGMNSPESTPAILPGVDPLPIGYRLLLASIGSAAIAGATSAVSDNIARHDSAGFGVFTAAWGGAVGLIVGNNVVRKRMQFETKFLQGLVPMVLALALAVFAGVPALSAEPNLDPSIFKVGFQFLTVILMTSTSLFQWTVPTRKMRLDFGQVLLSGGMAWVAGMMVNNHFLWIGVGIITAMSIVTQFVSAWTPKPVGAVANVPPPRRRETAERGATSAATSGGGSARPILAGIFAAIAFSVGVGSFIAGANTRSRSNIPIFVGGAVFMAVFSLGAARLAMLTRFRGMWRDVVRPFLTALFAGSAFGLFLVASESRGDDAAIFGALATLSSLLSLGLIGQALVSRYQRAAMRQEARQSAMNSPAAPPPSNPPLMNWPTPQPGEGFAGGRVGDAAREVAPALGFMSPARSPDRRRRRVPVVVIAIIGAFFVVGLLRATTAAQTVSARSTVFSEGMTRLPISGLTVVAGFIAIVVLLRRDRSSQPAAILAADIGTPSQRRPQPSRWIRGLTPFALLMGIIGYSLLSIAQVAGVATVFDVPGMIDTGFVNDPTLRQTLKSLSNATRSPVMANVDASAGSQVDELDRRIATARAPVMRVPTTKGAASVRNPTLPKVEVGTTQDHSAAANLRRLMTSQQTIRALQGLQTLRDLQVKLAASSMEAILNAARDSADTTGDAAVEETLRSLRANAAALIENLPAEIAASSETVQELDHGMGRATMPRFAPGTSSPSVPSVGRSASGVTVARSALLAAWVLLTAAATIFLLFARRSRGANHMVRGVVGVALLTLALVPFYATFGDGRFWPGRVGDSARTAVLEFAELATKPCVISTVLSVPAMALIAWPPRLGRREGVAG